MLHAASAYLIIGILMGKTTKATLVFLGLFIAAVIYLSTRVAHQTCRVCVTYAGRTICRTAASGTVKAAIESAVTSACSGLASGMTESIKCENTPPDSTECSEN
jgi:hypothetical protein